MEELKFFVASYISFFEIGFNDQVKAQVETQGIWAHSPDEVMGKLINEAEYPKPMDPNGVNIIEISPELAMEIISKGPALA